MVSAITKAFRDDPDLKTKSKIEAYLKKSHTDKFDSLDVLNKTIVIGSIAFTVSFIFMMIVYTIHWATVKIVGATARMNLTAPKTSWFDSLEFAVVFSFSVLGFVIALAILYTLYDFYEKTRTNKDFRIALNLMNDKEDNSVFFKGNFDFEPFGSTAEQVEQVIEQNEEENEENENE